MASTPAGPAVAPGSASVNPDGSGRSETAPEDAAAAFARLPLSVAGARVMLEHLQRVLKHEPGARDGDDPEEVHKMRVATRRLRAARRVFGKALGDLVDLDRANDELKTLAGALGRVRDPDVFADALREHARAAAASDQPALERLVVERERERNAAQADLRGLLDGRATTFVRSEFRATLDSLAAPRAGAASPAVGSAEAKRDRRRAKRRAERDTVARRAPDVIAKALRRLHQYGDDLLAPTTAELHEVRILAKRARYTCEFFAPGFGETLDAPIARLTEVQDTLGAIHDADVAIAALLGAVEGVAGDPARAADAAPIARLIGRYRDEREEGVGTFREQWRRLPRPKRLRRRLKKAAPGTW